MDAVQTLQTLQLDGSLFVGMNGNGGRWRDAEWSATISDPSTGELLVTAINAQQGDEPAMVGFRLGREFLLSLRGLAGIEGPLPVDEACAELAYLRECAQYAADMLKRVKSGLPGDDHMYQTYDAEHDAAQISFWDMKLLSMIEAVNTRLGVAVGGG